MKKKVTVSAPGKILLVGGYLVLEAQNVGLVVAADKRFYTTIESGGAAHEDGGCGSADRATSAATAIRVDSPQFHCSWEYRYDHQNKTLTASPSNGSTNPFVEKTLRVCFLYLMDRQSRAKHGDDASSSSAPCVLPPNMTITIQADNDFYSVLPHLPSLNKNSEDPALGTGEGKDGQDRSPEAVAALPRFLNCPVDAATGKAIVNKTGLGSSAALTTSLVGALVRYLDGGDDLGNDNDEDDDDDQATTTAATSGSRAASVIHNLAQICHCHAQGKVGSGFDVSAACHGTHVYRRFSSCLLADLLEQLDAVATAAAASEEATTPSAALSESLARLVELNPWRDDMVQHISLPPGNVQILLADVRGGSESPGMARKVLKWKAGARAAAAAASPDGIEIPFWTALGRLNTEVVRLVQGLTTPSSSPTDGADYDRLAALHASQWPDGSPLKELHLALREVRGNLRQLGEAAGVPIEPPPQTSLCDATMALPGVVAALVPGAGGYDAIVCLYVDRPPVLRAIGTLWASWRDPIICPLAVKASEEGFRVEVEE
jgi:phosphomevalonate kinase